jgi:hypothetical protein
MTHVDDPFAPSRAASFECNHRWMVIDAAGILTS